MFPVSAALIVFGFLLMPNRMYGDGLVAPNLSFEIGFWLALAGVALTAGSLLFLILWDQE
jgi:hypothetical protein